jgi:hypothetical protein
MNTTTTISPEVETLIRRMITDAMLAYDIERIDIVAEEEDYAGHPSIMVYVHYRLSTVPYDPAVTVELSHALWTAVRKLGEERFVHLRHKFDDHQPIAKRRTRTVA